MHSFMRLRDNAKRPRLWRYSGREDSQIQNYTRWRDLLLLQHNLQEAIQKTPSQVRQVAYEMHHFRLQDLSICLKLSINVKFKFG